MDNPSSNPTRPHTARYVQNTSPRTLWYQRRHDLRKAIGIIAGLLFLIFAFTATASLREYMQPSKNPHDCFESLRLGSKVFGVVCVVIFSAPRLLGDAMIALHKIVPRRSRLGKLVHHNTVVNIANVLLLAFQVVGLPNVVMAWVAFSCKPCDPESEKPLAWRVAQGTREHMKEGLSEWWTIVYSSVSIAYCLDYIGVWSSPGKKGVGWMLAAVASITALSTAACWYGSCIARMYFGQTWSVLSTVSFGLWFVGNGEYLFGGRLDDIHFELLWYVLIWYLISQAPGQLLC